MMSKLVQLQSTCLLQSDSISHTVTKLTNLHFYAYQILAREQIDWAYSISDWPNAGSCSIVSYAFF